MNKYGGMKLKSQKFLTSVLHGSEQLFSYCSCFTCGIQEAGGWMNPRADVNVVAKRKINVPAWKQTPDAQLVTSLISTARFTLRIIFIITTLTLDKNYSEDYLFGLKLKKMYVYGDR
jgi:hypothetical protein